MSIYGNYVGIGLGDDTGIVALNPSVKDMLLQAARPVNPSYNAYLSKTKPVVLLHFSDIHGDGVNLARVVQLLDHYSDMIDDAICTGDVVYTRWSNGIGFWTGVPGTEKILVAIGNHDVLTASSGYDWTQRATQAAQYERYMANISQWGATYTTGLTYYYKDYNAKKLRMIVLNCMLTGDDEAAQRTWLETALAGARTSGYTVVIAVHYPLGDCADVQCNFTSLDRSAVDTSEFVPTAYLELVATHKSNSGKFACWLAGHLHWDNVLKSIEHNGQLCICVDSANVEMANMYSDVQRTNDTKSQDLFNLTVIDTESTLIKIIRVGADRDRQLRPRNCITLDYSTGTVVTQS